MTAFASASASDVESPSRMAPMPASAPESATCCSCVRVVKMKAPSTARAVIARRPIIDITIRIVTLPRRWRVSEWEGCCMRSVYCVERKRNDCALEQSKAYAGEWPGGAKRFHRDERTPSSSAWLLMAGAEPETRRRVAAGFPSAVLG